MNRAYNTCIGRAAWLAALVLLGGCASDPFSGHEPTDLDRSITPTHAVTEMAKAQGRAVVWGGSIVAVHNLPDSTELAVISYPLDGGYPQSSKDSTGRFIVRYDGFLDPLSYSLGRPLTVLGRIDGVRKGMVGQAAYTYPIIKAERLHLWQRPPGLTYPRFTFGIGTGIRF